MFSIILNLSLLIWILYCVIKGFKGLKKKYSSREVQIITYGACYGMIGVTAINLVSKILIAITEMLIGG